MNDKRNTRESVSHLTEDTGNMEKVEQIILPHSSPASVSITQPKFQKVQAGLGELLTTHSRGRLGMKPFMAPEDSKILKDLKRPENICPEVLR